MKKAGFTLMILASSIILCLYAQTSGKKDKEYNEWYSEAIRLYELDEPSVETDSIALDLFNRCAGASLKANNPEMAVECFIKAGNIHQTYQRFTLSNQFYHRSLAVNDARLKNNRLKYEAFLYMGSSFYFSNIIDSAQHYFEIASAIAFNFKGGVLAEQERLYNSLGAIYFESANYLQAKNYFEKALAVTPLSADDYDESFVGIKSNIANCLLRLNQYDSALRIFKLLQTYDSQKDVSEIIQQNTAHTYFELGLYDSALIIYKQLPSGNALNRIKALNDIGRIYMYREQWQQSEVVFDSAIAVNKKISAEIKNKEEALAYLYRGQLAARQGLNDEAITWCNEALQEVHLTFKWKSIDDLPGDVSQTVSPITLFEILRTKASLLYKKYRATKQPTFLTTALAAYRKAIQTADFIKLNFDNDEAKLFFNRNYQPIYSEAIEVAYESCQVNKLHLDDYIFILENYKGNVLYQNLQNIQLKNTAQVPDSVRRREKDIKQLLAFYISRISNNSTEKDASQLQKRLLELHVELSRLQKQYDKDGLYNLYKQQSFRVDSSLGSIQSGIDDETALLNYFVADTSIYLLAISKKNTMIQKINAGSYFKKNINYYFDELYRHTEGSRYDGNKASAYLYRTLIQPVEKVVAARPKWIIIPDGNLYYLPVDGLLMNEQDKEYVIHTKTVSYHYSFALLLQKNSHHYNEAGTKETLAIAPFTEKDKNTVASGFSDLPFSRVEVQSISKNIFTSKDATKQRFMQKASQHSLIHLATHASIGTDSATNWIQFYPADSNSLNNKLFVPEIYNMDLHRAELIILSACETAGGTTTSGEGLLSLSRAFLYAGSDGIISTLWKTEDQVTAYLMQQLHIHLKQNLPPEKALQQAKIDLLNNKNFGVQYKTPNYWSNFIYVGKVETKNDGRRSFWWMIIILLALAGLFVYRKIKKFRHQLPEPG